MSVGHRARLSFCDNATRDEAFRRLNFNKRKPVVRVLSDLSDVLLAKFEIASSEDQESSSSTGEYDEYMSLSDWGGELVTRVSSWGDTIGKEAIAQPKRMYMTLSECAGDMITRVSTMEEIGEDGALNGSLNHDEGIAGEDACLHTATENGTSAKNSPHRSLLLHGKSKAGVEAGGRYSRLSFGEKKVQMGCQPSRVRLSTGCEDSCASGASSRGDEAPCPTPISRSSEQETQNPISSRATLDMSMLASVLDPEICGEKPGITAKFINEELRRNPRFSTGTLTRADSWPLSDQKYELQRDSTCQEAMKTCPRMLGKATVDEYWEGSQNRRSFEGPAPSVTTATPENDAKKPAHEPVSNCKTERRPKMWSFGTAWKTIRGRPSREVSREIRKTSANNLFF